MGSEIDILKLRSSLLLFLEATGVMDETFRAQAREILSVINDPA